MPAAKQGGGTTRANIFKRLKSVLLLKFLRPGGGSVTLCGKRDSSAVKPTSVLNFSRLRVFFWGGFWKFSLQIHYDYDFIVIDFFISLIIIHWFILFVIYYWSTYSLILIIHSFIISFLIVCSENTVERYKSYVQKWPALISRRERELPQRADLSGYLACNLLPANRVSASKRRGNRSHLVFRVSGCSQWWGLKAAHWSPRSKNQSWLWAWRLRGGNKTSNHAIFNLRISVLLLKIMDYWSAAVIWRENSG